MAATATSEKERAGSTGPGPGRAYESPVLGEGGGGSALAGAVAEGVLDALESLAEEVEIRSRVSVRTCQGVTQGLARAAATGSGGTS